MKLKKTCMGWLSPAGGGAGGGVFSDCTLGGEKLKADTTNNYAYNKKLQPFANKLRKEMTKAEACLWKYALRAGQMKLSPAGGGKGA